MTREHEYEYTIKTDSRVRKMKLSVHANGSVIVTVPRFTPHFLVRILVRQHAEWIDEKLATFRKRKVTPLPALPRGAYKKHKEAARSLATERLSYFNQHYRFTFARISIRDTKSRWGSCSSKGNLNFSYKIALLPPHLADYIIVHELCHLKEMNHSPRFWDLVAQKMPEHKAHRKELRSIRFG